LLPITIPTIGADPAAPPRERDVDADGSPALERFVMGKWWRWVLKYISAFPRELPSMSKPPHGDRPPRPPAGTRTQATPPSVERATALRDVMDHAVRVQREVTQATPLRRSRAPRLFAVGVCMALIGMSVYSVIARPEFIWGRSSRQPDAATQASLRLGLYVLSQRIETFRTEHSRYPVALDEVDEGARGVHYALLGDSVYVLRAVSGVDTALFRSDDAPGTLLAPGTGVSQSDGRSAP
jgi:hypothetical protein